MTKRKFLLGSTFGLFALTGCATLFPAGNTVAQNIAQAAGEAATVETMLKAFTPALAVLYPPAAPIVAIVATLLPDFTNAVGALATADTTNAALPLAKRIVGDMTAVANTGLGIANLPPQVTAAIAALNVLGPFISGLVSGTASASPKVDQARSDVKAFVAFANHKH